MKLISGLNTSKKIFILPMAIMLTYCGISCNKLVHIPPPANSITTSQTFMDSADAVSALTGIYTVFSSGLGGGSLDFGNGALTVFPGLSADELLVFGSNQNYIQFYLDDLTALNGSVFYFLWSRPYSLIYQTNACIEGASLSQTLPINVKNEVLGEAKFLRAFIYFYLTNLYGDVPYVTSSSWPTTSKLGRSKQITVYDSIISDLKQAQLLLPEDYSAGNGERVRANKFAATALLARTYLYLAQWSNAESASSALIDSSNLYQLDANLNDVFNANSTESILQWQLNTGYYPFNSTIEGNLFIPFDRTSNPQFFYLSNSLLSDFELGDARRSAWVDSTIFSGSVYYYPVKYNIGPSEQVVNGQATQYYTALRLSEQYLIRSEARAQLGDMNGALNDINIVRNRAGLTNAMANDQNSLLKAIAHERRIELFCEWGHRWLDLKRTGQVGAILQPLKPKWNINSQLYPIGHSELINDPNLTQNVGY